MKIEIKYLGDLILFLFCGCKRKYNSINGNIYKYGSFYKPKINSNF